MAAHYLAPIEGECVFFTIPPPLFLQHAPSNPPFIIQCFLLRSCKSLDLLWAF